LSDPGFSPPRDLGLLGWDEQWQELLQSGGFGESALVGRVAVRHKSQYAVWTSEGEIPARIRGVLRYQAADWSELPVVGDWVACTRKGHEHLWHIREVLARRTVLTRKDKGTRATPQVLVANVSVVLIVMGLTEDYNLRRLERYLIIARESGAKPVVVLNKADVLPAEMVEDSREEIAELAGDVPLHVVSALEARGLAPLAEYLGRGETVVVVGSSGAGKSTLANALLGTERQRTGEVRDTDGKGRHTTTVREMIPLPSGAILIDTPGIREIQLWENDEGLDSTFADIEELAQSCRFRDCTHTSEPGCAILAAIEEGSLDPDRLASYGRLREELRHLASRQRENRETTRRIFKDMGRGRGRKRR
jgi:ribosome biogenesis GTPase